MANPAFPDCRRQQRTHLQDGDKVAITRFRNGDQLIVNKNSGETFFVYADSDKLLPCNRTEKRDADILSLERYDDRQHPFIMPPQGADHAIKRYG